MNQEAPSNAFAFLLAEQRDGQCSHEASSALSECIQAVELTGKTAKLTITLTIETTKAGAVVVSDDIKTKLPEPEKESSIFFPNEQGGLQRNDPRQRTFEDLKVVGGGKVEMTIETTGKTATK